MATPVQHNAAHTLSKGYPMASRIESLKKRKEAIDLKIKELAAKELRKVAANEKRQKIILGGWLMKHRPDLVNNIVASGLEREQDKKAFADWEPLKPLNEGQES
jgi:hypothetical protein